MSYTVTDIVQLADYNLYCAGTIERGVANIEELICRLQALIGHEPGPILWILCDGCGCSVEDSLVNDDGPNYAADGDFYCSDCWPGTSR